MQYPVTQRAFGLAILVLSGLQLMVVLDGTVVIFALPRLQDQMGLSSAGSAWTVTSYGLTFAGLMLLGGRLGDAFGRKRMLIVGVGVFTLASLVCGLAQGAGMLIGARAVQGAGAAIAAPAALALVATTFAPGPARNQAIAIVGSMVGIGSVGGLVVGGALTEVSWRWIFLINVPIGALIVLGAVYCLADTGHHRVTLDIRGAVLGTLACAAIVFGATEGPQFGWTSPVIIGSIAGGLILLVIFVLAERNVNDPLLPWSLFDSRDRVTTFLLILLAGGVLGAMTYFVAQFMQNVIGYSPLQAGLASIPFTIGIGVGGALASKLAMLVAPRWLLTGAATVLAIGLLFGSTLDGDVSYLPTLLILLLVIGFGVGIAMVVAPLCVLVNVPPSDIGPLAAVGQMFMNLGTPMAIGVLTPIAVSRTLSLGGTTGKASEMNPAEIAALGSGYTFVLAVCAGIAVLIGLIALTLRFTPQQVAQAHHAQEEAQRA
ncbi:MFS transporter [Nocardia puris]|uniref:EmrB/QacA subfamily drug resistance transporter n=1 Tax=Nocardia puris TaxID=208602 RepID=A0A366E2N5_9NOCA|nr:MFS transporter [Nocardia puris]MBF6212555.1 MFS transporter [Nocardia puris]MBF6369135.1 MFS transporter [Nocardia puris]MBF6463336.1 MFS transporter [Nocardia puris]RBO96630.1 EmrB/QacA subfamily drug resistance transporter [Nocardia puris]